MATLHIIPDTNALIHFRRADQVSWKSIAPDVVIVLSPLVLREIDKHKNTHPIGRIRDRARDLAGWIRKLIKGEAPAGSNAVHIETREPTAFLTPPLESSVPDDALIATALMYVAEGKEVAVFTDDSILQAKLPGFNIRSLWPEDTDRLKEEPDPIRAENEKLKLENRRLLSRQPKPSVLWPNTTAVLEVEVPKPDLSDLRPPADVRRELPLLTVPDLPTSAAAEVQPKPGTLLDISKLFGTLEPGRDEVIAYNQALEAYFGQYETYVERATFYWTTAAQIVALPMVAINYGTAVATSFRAIVTLPKGMKLLDPKRLIGKPPTAPQPPKKLGTPLNLLGDRLETPWLHTPAYLDLAVGEDEPELDLKTGTIELSLRKLQHRATFEFANAYALIHRDLIGRGAELAVEVICDELPDPVRMTLSMRFVAE